MRKRKGTDFDPFDFFLENGKSPDLKSTMHVQITPRHNFYFLGPTTKKIWPNVLIQIGYCAIISYRE